MEFQPAAEDPWQPNSHQSNESRFSLDQLSNDPFYVSLLERVKLNEFEIDNIKARSLFELSGLDPFKINDIITSCTKSSKMTKHEFCLILVFIAFAQNKQEPSFELIEKNLDNLPKPIFIEEDPKTSVTQPEIVSEVLNPITLPTISEEKVIVNEAGLEGISFFKHLNYSLESLNNESKVLRRYSDFYYVYKYLLKNYSCRLILPIPPKRLNPSGDFLEKRRRGLIRFAHFINNHPVFKKDEIVVSFFTQQLENETKWKSQQYQIVEDIPTEIEAYINNINTKKNKNFTKVPEDFEVVLEKELKDAIFLKTNVSKIINYMFKYHLQRISDGKLFSEVTQLSTYQTPSENERPETINLDNNRSNKPKIQDSIGLVHEQHPKLFLQIKDASSISLEHASNFEIEIIEKFKMQRDLLQALIDMIQRSKNENRSSNLTGIKNRIQSSKSELVKLQQEEVLNHSQISALNQSIEHDEQTMVSFHLKIGFIKRCLQEEILFYKELFKKLNDQIFNAFSNENSVFARRWAHIWSI